ncbi:MAG: RraA family protein, partial [Sphingomonadales bacterium]|nr:RraA family protein [Sphingomonadales bacterium]
GPGNTAYLGDLLAANIVNRGLAGAVIDGLVRDRASIARSPATFVARGVTPVNLRRRDPGRAMVEVRVGGVAVSPGDWLVADDDGVIAIAPGEAAAAIAAALRMARVEKRIRELVLQRVPVPEAVRQALAEAGD